MSVLSQQKSSIKAPLHYVKNHGAVPKLDWNTHRLVVNGLVSNPLNLSMDDIVNMPYREFPVTLACAGNRRKEQNMIKQLIGFNWGSSAEGTAIWRGVSLHHVLKLAGCSLDVDYEEPRYVCFVGADNLPNGPYETSLTLEWSMNDSRDVLLAYEMNGERLAPDHGYPIRVIIPGVIGGRMVKWLTKITVTNKESESYYHRVLDVERANKEGCFVSTSEHTLNGYAYSGEGRKVISVEVGFDDGKIGSSYHLLVLKRSSLKR